MVYVRFISFIVCAVVYILVINYMGQRIINKSEGVFQAAYYDSKWYVMPAHLRRMILLVQNNSTKYQGLTAAKMGKITLEAAGIVITILIIIILVENCQI